MYDGDIIISAYAKAMNGKQPSKPLWDYTNPQL